MEYNRKKFLKEVVNQFINKNDQKSARSHYDYLISLINKDTKLEHAEQNREKREILEKCFNIFSNLKVRQAIEESTLKRYELVPIFTAKLSEMVLGDQKRKYDMSQTASDGMLTTRTTSDGTTEKLVALKPVDGLSVTVPDHAGGEILIQHIGVLAYATQSLTETIDKFRISKQNKNNVITTYEVFSNIDLNQLSENDSYCKAVLDELLSKNNLELSNADGYIGEISNTTESPNQLNVGDEIDSSGYYRYQISPEYALEYDGERIEAIRAYNQEQEKIDKQQKKDEGR